MSSVTASPLAGQTAIVTGSSSGLGLAIARRLHRAGCALVLHGTHPERTAAAAAELGPHSASVLGDVADPATAPRLLEAALQLNGRLDIFVNNAGAVKMQPFLDFSLEAFQNHLNTHLTGTLLGAQTAARYMAAHGGGRILNVSSIAGSFGQFGFTGYSTVKAGIEALTRVMAVELAAHKISVNAIAPGPVWNEMMEQLYGPERLAERCRTIPMQRLATGEEVAELAHYLCLPESGYMTGQVLRMDGGASSAGPFTMEVFKRSNPA